MNSLPSIMTFLVLSRGVFTPPRMRGIKPTHDEQSRCAGHVGDTGDSAAADLPYKAETLPVAKPEAREPAEEPEEAKEQHEPGTAGMALEGQRRRKHGEDRLHQNSHDGIADACKGTHQGNLQAVAHLGLPLFLKSTVGTENCRRTDSGVGVVEHHMTLQSCKVFILLRKHLLEDGRNGPGIAKSLHALIVPGKLQSQVVPPHGIDEIATRDRTPGFVDPRSEGFFSLLLTSLDGLEREVDDDHRQGSERDAKERNIQVCEHDEAQNEE